ncbi:MAG: hypothetical protein EKK29_06125 [Hyphomicrobiales bacterium]|nr:MAG: hypothetical protein EKK29_06125 [Hyphomicrobiales bacterium]
MHHKFIAETESLEPAFERLINCVPFASGKLMPKVGVYLFSEDGQHRYVGRSNNICQRYGQHTRPGSPYNQASFANLMAMRQLGYKASYRPGEGKKMRESEEFRIAFEQAKDRIRKMEFRAVDETEPVRQALLEIYCAVVLGTEFNGFDNH